MKRRRLISILLTAVMTSGSIFSEYAYAAPEDDIDTEIILEEETAAGIEDLVTE